MRDITAKIQLNDIFQPESEKLIKERIDYALNKEGSGKNFWEHFFLCHNSCDTAAKCANKEIIIYLFTEQQLCILRDWWDLNTGETCVDQVLKNNFINSNEYFKSMGCFEDAVILPVYACCIKNNKSLKHPEIVRLIFGKSPMENLPYECIDFFEENKKFCTIAEEFSIERQTEIFLGLVNNLRPIIEKILEKFLVKKGKIKLKKDKYILFLGNNYCTHRWLEYCKNVNPKCPLVRKAAGDRTNNTDYSVQGNV